MAKINLGPIQQLPKIAIGTAPGEKLPAPSGLPGGNGGNAGTFANMLTDAVSSTNDQMLNADLQGKAMLAGESKNIHEVMIALEKANLSFRFLTQVRNKAVEAYQEVFRMQL